MTIPVLPTLDRTSPTFRADTDAFFGSQLPAFSAALNPEIERINQIGAGSFAATSGDTLTISLGTVSLAIEAGKGFSPGQPVMIARTAAPGDYMTGQVLSYDRSTGAMQVDVTLINVTGAHTGWSVSIVSILSALQLDSIIVLTSGTSWTCPDGVKKVRGYVEGGSGGGGGGNGSTLAAGAGGGGGGAMFIATVMPGQSYTYVIGGGGAGATVSGGTGSLGGSTTITIGGVSYTGDGGGGGEGSNQGRGGDGGSGSGVGAMFVRGVTGDSSPSHGSSGGRSAFGFGVGGRASLSSGMQGSPGRITLELYK